MVLRGLDPQVLDVFRDIGCFTDYVVVGNVHCPGTFNVSKFTPEFPTDGSGKVSTVDVDRCGTSVGALSW